jgi:acyl-CoA synthetase (AMP-forming)/AMP-acid ligase II
LSATPAAIIRASARQFGRKPAAVELSCTAQGEVIEGRSASYEDLFQSTLRACGALHGCGVGAGDRLAVLLDNSIDMIVSEWACLSGGFVWVALNTRSSAAELRAVLDDCSPAVLLVANRYADLASEAGAPPGCRVLRAESEWCELLDGAVAPHALAEPCAEAPVRIRYTSGTAGLPKGAVLPRRAYEASIETVGRVIGPISAGDVLVQIAPMSHAAGAMLLPHVAAGAHALLVDRFEADTFLSIVERYRATTAFLVPTMLVRVLDALRDTRRLASLRTIVYGGASMPVAPLQSAVERLGPVFVQIYGLTECTWPVTALAREEHARRPGEDGDTWRARLASCGKPTGVADLRIVDSRGHDCGRGRAGELRVRGRNTMLGYWKSGAPVRRHEAKGLDTEGWLHTGDVAFQDAEGFVTIVDRLHDMIVSGGFNVYPREVEDALCSHPAVLEAAVVGLANPEWGETVHAAVVLRPGADVTADALVEHCGRRLAGYKKPRSLEIVASLPRNAAGKILRRALRHH